MNILARASRVLGAASSATLAGSLALPGFPNDAARAGTAKQPLNYSGIAGGYHYGFIGEVTLRHLGASYFHPSTNSRRDGFSIEAFVEPSAGNLDLDLDDPDADEVRRELDTSEFAGIPVDSTKGVLLSDWADFDAQSLKWQENRFKIAWIIGNSPLKNCLDTKPVDLGRFQCYADELNRILKPESPYNSDKTDSALEYVEVATQAAIWRFTDGLILDRTALRDPDEIDEENDALMFAVYDYLVANAPEMTEPSFDQHTISGEVGTTLGPVTLTSPQIATITATLPDGFELLDGEGKPVGATAESGTTFSLRVPAHASVGESLTLTATTVHKLQHGRLTSSGASMITTDPTTATISATATFTWTAPSGDNGGGNISSPPTGNGGDSGSTPSDRNPGGMDPAPSNVTPVPAPKPTKEPSAPEPVKGQ